MLIEFVNVKETIEVYKYGSLVICVTHISLINQTNKEYPSMSRYMRWNKWFTLKMP